MNQGCLLLHKVHSKFNKNTLLWGFTSQVLLSHIELSQGMMVIHIDMHKYMPWFSHRVLFPWLPRSYPFPDYCRVILPWVITELSSPGVIELSPLGYYRVILPWVITGLSSQSHCKNVVVLPCRLLVSRYPSFLGIWMMRILIRMKMLSSHITDRLATVNFYLLISCRRMQANICKLNYTCNLGNYV